MEIVVFTNGCFDLIHPGHLDLLKKARSLGTKLIVGINSDKSVRAIKGKERPFLSQDARAAILKEFRSVDEVYVFEENTPERLIKEIQPDVLVKGGDWAVTEIVGADFVLQRGGKVFSIPFEKDISSSKIVEKIKSKTLKGDNVKDSAERNLTTNEKLITDSLKSYIKVFENLLSGEISNISKCADLIYKTLAGGNKVFFIGDGTSAAVSQYLAAEFTGCFEREWLAFQAIALESDTSGLKALSKDDGFDMDFRRQIEAQAQKNDLLIAMSTSSNPPNIISAVMKAREIGCRTIALTGINGKKIAALCDANISVSVERTSQIQEVHLTIGQLWCEIIDEKFKNQINI